MSPFATDWSHAADSSQIFRSLKDVSVLPWIASFSNVSGSNFIPTFMVEARVNTTATVGILLSPFLSPLLSVLSSEKYHADSKPNQLVTMFLLYVEAYAPVFDALQSRIASGQNQGHHSVLPERIFWVYSTFSMAWPVVTLTFTPSSKTLWRSSGLLNIDNGLIALRKGCLVVIFGWHVYK